MSARHFHRSNFYSNIPHYWKKPSTATKSSVHQRFMLWEAFVTIWYNFRRVVPSHFPQNKSIKRDGRSKSRFFWTWIRKCTRERTKLQRRCNCCTKTHNHSSVQHKVQAEIKKRAIWPKAHYLLLLCLRKLVKTIFIPVEAYKPEHW